jgi:hypothetical protein
MPAQEIIPSGIAKDASIGTDGASPPAIAGTGVRGWLRAIYERLLGAVSTRLMGNPSGDFAGLDLIEDVIDDAGDLSFRVRMVNAEKRDVQGAQVFSDAPAPITWYNGAVGPGPLIDTTGYNSIVITFSGANGTYNFQTTNDPATLTAALANVAGWLHTSAAAPVSSLAATAGATITLPVLGRYFRPYCTVAGTAGMITIQLRSAPAVPISLNANVTNATVVVSGNVAPGTAASANPVAIGGQDQGALTRRFMTDANGYLTPTGPLRAGWALGQYNVSFGGYSQILASATAAYSTLAPIPFGGVDTQTVVRFLQTDSSGRLIVRTGVTDNADQSDAEQLANLVAAQRATVHLLTQLVALARGFPDPAPGEEADSLIGEFLSRANSFTNLPN